MPSFFPRRLSGPGSPKTGKLGPFGPKFSILRALRARISNFRGPSGHISHLLGPAGTFAHPWTCRRETQLNEPFFFRRHLARPVFFSHASGPGQTARHFFSEPASFFSRTPPSFFSDAKSGFASFFFSPSLLYDREVWGGLLRNCCRSISSA